MHNCDEGVNPQEVIILAGEGLSTLRDSWTETQAGRESLEIKKRIFREFRY